LEEGLELLRVFVRGEEALAGEILAARAEFFGAPRPAAGDGEDEPADERFFEWFLFERPSRRYGEVPYLSFLRRSGEDLATPVRDILEQMAESVFGVFEVESVAPGSGMTLTDLLSGRSIAVREEQAEALVQVTDTLVGRLFPIDGEEFLLSGSVACFRSPELREAIAADLARAHAAAPTARLSQREIERLLWSGPVAPGGVEAEVRALLEAARLPDLAFEEVRLSFAAASTPGAVIGPLLDRLAFDTEVDLERARHTLLAFWEETREARPETKSRVPAADARAAVEAFERGRARGENLEELFERLERDLGLEGEPDPDDAPDPALEQAAANLAPLVEEFLWERDREVPSASAARSAALRALVRYLAERVVPPVDQLEDVEPDHLRGFARDLLLAPRSEEEALGSLLHLEDFLGWGRQEQGIDIFSRTEEVLRELRRDLSRFFRFRATLPASAPESPGHAGFLVRVGAPPGSDEILVETAEGSAVEPIHARVAPSLAPILLERDLIRGSLEERGDPVRFLRVTDLVPAGLRGPD
jgi:hypothetical protein